MSGQLEELCEIRVSTNIKGVPLGFSRNGQWQKVTVIYERWQVSNEWRSSEPGRYFFRIKTSKGLVCDIYRDMMAKRWYVSKIHEHR